MFLYRSTRHSVHAGRATDSFDLLHMLRAVGDDRSVPVAYQRWCTQDAGQRAPRAGRPWRSIHSPAAPGSGCREAGTMDSAIKVAVVRSDRRRGAVAEAIAL